jgi:tRNA threonylcarbamoyladenosine biosynthesis protein TsaE
MQEFVTDNPGATRALGEAIAHSLVLGDVVLLSGDLGAGKTTLTQGIAAELGIVEPVQSPTFTLVGEHLGRLTAGEPVRLYHLDLYRLRDAADLESFGFDQYLAPEDGISVIEWPERAGSWLPDAYLAIEIEPAGPDARRITVRAIGRPALSLDHAFNTP